MLIDHLGSNLLPHSMADTPPGSATISGDITNVLFVGTANSGRSIIAEAVLNHLGRGRFRAYSAGVRHTGKVSGMALDVLNRAGFDATSARSKPLDLFTLPNPMAVMHMVITVSEDSSGLNTGALPGHPVQGHWPTADPLDVVGTEPEIAAVYESVLATLVDRVFTLISQPLKSLDPVSLQRQLNAIGRDGRRDAASSLSMRRGVA